MKAQQLTSSACAAKVLPMQNSCFSRPGSGWHTACVATMLLGSAMALPGCISVSAPDKPIVIELNINIKQEVIYRLAADAANTIESNPEIF